ncbi:nidogen-like isoform X2 [Eriocheir sinensis]|uniref:nidogen-like isoform X2 n=1 Tax=Eriocheir sinensis TaxID=95602 RepID=UPI0021C9FE3D|nr:nidogen-like isoform X2 [Eriocheir sinensis]
MELRGFLLYFVLLATLLVAPSRAVLKSYFYRFGEDAGDTPLPDEDEISSPETRLRVPIVFFGQIYDSIFINSNGFISFLTEIPNFFNVQFPLEYPIIAPFYSDVDAREAGAIWYRETSDPGTVARAKAEVRQHFSDAAAFEPKGVFIVTWDGVGPYNQRTDRINTYQLILVTDGQESYALFHYADGGIQWLKGDGKNPSLADARGQAGLVSGDGRYFLLKGSGTDQVRSLDKWSNCGNPGVWMFRIGQLSLSETVQPPDLDVDESTNQDADLIQSCALGGSLCHSKAKCIDYTPGFCCSCEEDYLGNGINCVPKGEPIRINGKVIGDINGVTLTDADLHSYVLTSEGRSYTALSRIPSQIGYDLQSITAIGTGIAWLFASPVNNVKNGFSLTGGSLNRTVEVDFPQTGHRVEVQQQFKGLDVFNYVKVKTQITGSVPTIPVGSKIEMNAFSEEYTKVKPGQLRARSSRVFRLKGQSIDTPFTVETTIDFDDCEWRALDVGEQETLRLKVPENIFIQYDSAEEIVRYALSAKLAPLEEIDPCVEGRQECGENSQCVVDGDTFRCVCARGYEELYDATLNKGICLDLNECSTSRHSCHTNAICTNTPGSFTCTCKPDFTGDGFNCEKVGSCDGIPCDPNALCERRYGETKCVCRPGFFGDGLICTREIEVSSVQQQSSCVDYDVCGRFAECVYDDSVRSFRCECLPGYSGDGQTCQSVGPETCETARNCSPYGVCIIVGDEYRCQCMPGFTGDGYSCEVADSVTTVYQPEEPKQPYYPEEPQQPYYPEEPQQPYNPEEPQQPYNPEEPQQPYNPEEPQQPYNPEEPQQPYYPEEPQQPYYPEEPQQPYYPEEPQQPYYPEEPQQPYNPEEPQQPYYPEEPQQPYPQEPQQPYPQEPEQPHQIEESHPTEQSHHAESSKPQLPKILEPECVFGVCWCPSNYGHNPQHNHCELIDASSSSAKEESEVHEVARPLPECFHGRCSCPRGYSYDYTQNACLSSNTPGYNYNIQGGGHEQTASCHDVNNCHPNAQCMYDSYIQSYSCRCNAGYDGDGIYCNKLDVSCDRVDICHIHAQCIFDDQTLQHVCVCLAGYQGDGQVCTPQDECNSVVDCDVNAQCLYDSSSQRYKCSCNEGYEGDGRLCTPRREAGCNIINNCDPNADCIYDTYALGYRCQCLDGYQGDGLFCSPVQIGCNILQNCGENAVCSYNVEAKGYRCSCQEGFEGDGFFCKSSRSCQFDPTVCHPQAICVSEPLSPYEYKCQCQKGFTGDGLTCQEAANHEKDILLLNQGLAVLRMPVDPQGGRSYIIHFEAFMTAVGADIDCLAGRFYWTDVRSSSIRSSKYDGTERRPMVTQGNIGFPEDIAVDWVSKNIYWTDSSNDVVSVASIEDGKQLTVIKDGLVNPRGIAVHPGYGLLFWSDWNRLAPKIEASDLDGSNRRVIVDEDISLPNSLVVDYETNTLCWADAGTNKIECVGVQGSGRRVVTTGPRYPFGLTISGQNFYYTDWNDTKIHTVDRYSGAESPARVPPPGGSGKLYGISAVPESCPPVSNACAVDDGGCPSTHLCLPNSRGGRTCACPDPASQDEVTSCQTYTY